MSDVLIVVGPLSGPVRKGDLAAVGFGDLLADRSGGAVDVLVLGPTTWNPTPPKLMPPP